MTILRYGSIGIWVELLQSTLRKIGYYNGAIDGIFGPKTRRSVYWFQSEFGLVPDGVVGNRTWEKLMPYINGTVGSIVPTDMRYPYKILMMNLEALQVKYPFLEVFYYGQSVLGKKIPYIRLGRGSKTVFYIASIHANEWINSVVFMKFIEDFCDAYSNNQQLRGFNVREILEDTTIYLAPMLNPDGVDLVTGVMAQTMPAYKEAVRISENYPNIPFPNGWKANIRRSRFEFTVPGRMGKSKRDKVCTRICKPSTKRFCWLWASDRARSFKYI